MTKLDTNDGIEELVVFMILEAMSVVPIAWLTAGEIAAEMDVVACLSQDEFMEQMARSENGRSIAPILKRLLKEGKIVRSEQGNPFEYCLSDKMKKEVLKTRGFIK